MKLKNTIQNNITFRDKNVKHNFYPIFIILTLMLTIACCVMLFNISPLNAAGDAYSTHSGNPNPPVTASITVGTQYRSGGGGNPVYAFTCATGGKLFIIRFQPKEVYDLSKETYLALTSTAYNELNGFTSKDARTTATFTLSSPTFNSTRQPDTTIKSSAVKPARYALSGYTINDNSFEELGFLTSNGLNWNSTGLGKVYFEYGTLGIKFKATGDNTDSKQRFITGIIDTDFKDALPENIDASQVDLLNAFAYRSQVITYDRLSKSLVYVPRDLVAYDKLPTWTDDLSNDIYKNYYKISPLANSIVNKMTMVMGKDNARNTKTFRGLLGYMHLGLENYNVLTDDTLKMDNKNDRDLKFKIARRLESIVATAYPILAVSEDGRSYSTLLTQDPDNPSSAMTYSISTSDYVNLPKSLWNTAILYKNYYIEDTRHEYKNSTTNYLELTSSVLDTHDSLSHWLTDELDEDKLYDEIFAVYKKRPDYAYAVLDAVFGGINETAISTGTTLSSSYLPDTLYHCDFTKIESSFSKWLTYRSDAAKNAKTDITKLAGIRQAQFNTALYYILINKCDAGDIDDGSDDVASGNSIDPHSNIEISIASIYTSVVVGNGTSDSDISQKAAEKAVKEEGWNAFDSILCGTQQSYAITYDTLCSIAYNYGDLISNESRVPKLALATYYSNTLGYVPLNVGSYLLPIVGRTATNDNLTQTLMDMGNLAVKTANNTGSMLTLKLGSDNFYPDQTQGKDKTNYTLYLNDQLRQSYFVTLLSRQNRKTTDVVASMEGPINRGTTYYSAAGLTFTGDNAEGDGYVTWTEYTPENKLALVVPASRRYGTNGQGYSLNYMFENGTSGKTVTMKFDGEEYKVMDDAKQSANASIYISLGRRDHSDGANAARLIVQTSSADLGFDASGTNVSNKIDSANVRSNGFAVCSAGQSEIIAQRNYASSDMLKMSWKTYIPDRDASKPEVVATKQDGAVICNGSFYLFYHRNFYKEAETGVQMQTVLGFEKKNDKTNTVTHELNPNLASDYKIACGINFDQATIDLMEQLIKDGNELYLRVGLSGANNGQMSLIRVTKNDNTTLSFSKFNLAPTHTFTLATFAGAALPGYHFFNAYDQIKPYLTKTFDASVAAQTKIYFNNYTNDKDALGYTGTNKSAYTAEKQLDVPKNSTGTPGDIYEIKIDEATLKTIKKVANGQADELIKSDTTFMLKLKDWEVSSLIGAEKERLAQKDTESTLKLDTTYVIGAEAQLCTITTDKNPKVLAVTHYVDSTGTDYTNVGLGLYSGLYTNAIQSGQAKVKVVARYNSLSTVGGTTVTDVNSYAERKLGKKETSLVGPGTNSHMYIKFTDVTNDIPQWKFTGHIGLEWADKGPNATDPEVRTKILYREIVSNVPQKINALAYGTIDLKYQSNDKSLKDLYNLLKDEGAKYIAFTFKETNVEDTFVYPNLASLSENSNTDKVTLSDTLMQSVWTDKLDSTNKKGGLAGGMHTFSDGTVVFTLEQFFEMFGGTTSTLKTADAKLVDITVSDKFIEMLAEHYNVSATTNTFNGNRIECDFIASVYAFGNDSLLSSASSTAPTKNLIQQVTSNEQTLSLDITNGLTYLIRGQKGNSVSETSNTNIKAAWAREKKALLVAGLSTSFSGSNFYKQLTKTATNRIVQWQPTDIGAGAGSAIPRSYLEDITKKSDLLTMSLGDNLEDDGDAWLVAVSSSEPVKTPDPPLACVIRTTAPIAYAQVKQGGWQTNNEYALQSWNVLTGLPSTEKFYITSGGNEFIVEMVVEEIQDETAYRSYISHFAANDCKYLKGDTASAGGGNTTSVVKATVPRTLGSYNATSSVTDKFTLPVPSRAKTATYTVSAHGNGEVIKAQWTGTIANDTPDPGVVLKMAPVDNLATPDASTNVSASGNGKTLAYTVGHGQYFTGYAGEMNNASGQEKEAGGYKWKVKNYNDDLKAAYNWAVALETASKGNGNIIITSNSDGGVRRWHVGDAQIRIEFADYNSTASTINEKHTTAYHGNWTNRTLTTANVLNNAGTAGGGVLLENDKALTSGWFEHFGKLGTASGTSCQGSQSSGTGNDINPSVWTWTDQADLLKWQSQGHPKQIPYSYIGSWTVTHTPTDGYSSACTYSDQSNIIETTYPEEFYGCCVGTNIAKKKDAKKPVHSCTSSIESGPKPGTSCPGHGTDEDGYPNPCTCTHTKYTCSYTAGGTGTPAGTHTCTASHSTTGVTDTTTVKAKDVQYTITVTFKNTYTDGIVGSEGTAVKTACPDGTYPAHCCCGPCCCHHLPAISDEWVQYINYATLRITDVRVNKLYDSYVEGLNQITLDYKDKDKLVASVREGDANIFYNIALENSVYNDSVVNDNGGYGDYAVISRPINGASLSGRIRYSLQAQQHDTVLWNEYYTAGNSSTMKRTPECDGQAKTSDQKAADEKSYNPISVGGKGHEHAWSNGILYRRSTKNNDVYYTKSGDFNSKFTHQAKWLKSIETTAVKTKYTNNSLDAKDLKTVEYKRFKERRETLNTCMVNSDILVLQGGGYTGLASNQPGGDTVILNKTVKATTTKTTEEDYDKTKDNLTMDIKRAFGLSKSDIANKKEYTYEGGGTAVDIPYDIAVPASSPIYCNFFAGYTGEGARDDLRNQTAKGYGVVSTYLDSDGTSFDATINHPDNKAQVASARTYSTVTTEVGKTDASKFKSSVALYQKRIAPTTNTMRIGEIGFQIDPTTQNRIYLTTKATQTWFQILNYTEGKVHDSAKLDNEYYKPTTNYTNKNGTVKVFEQEAYYYGSTSTGYLDPKYKVNDVIIHTPISSVNTFLMMNKDEMDDQRIFGQSSPAVYDPTTGCPGTSLLCEHSYLSCSYTKTKMVYHTYFNDTYDIVDKHGQVATYPGLSMTYTGNTIDTTGYVTSVTDIVNRLTTTLKNGFVTLTNSSSYGQGIVLNGTPFPIALAKLGVEPITGTSYELDIVGSFSIGTEMFRQGNIVATVRNGYIEVSNGLATYNFSYSYTNGVHSYRFIFDYDSLAKFQLYVDGTKINGTNGSPAPNANNVKTKVGDWASTIYIGDRCTLYEIAIKHLPGTTEHTDGCYETYQECEKQINYTCDAVTRFVGSYKNSYTAFTDGQYLIELYDPNTGKYQSKKISMKKGDTIYAYLGNKGYWSTSSTDSCSTSTSTATSVVESVNTANITAISTVLVDQANTSNSVSFSQNLTPGVYRISASIKGTKVGRTFTVLQSGSVSFSISTPNTLSVSGTYVSNITSVTPYDVTVRSTAIDYKLTRVGDASSYSNIQGITYSTSVAQSSTPKTTTLTTTSNLKLNTGSASGSIVLTPGVYLLRSVDKDGNEASGFYRVDSNTTLYYNNSTAGQRYISTDAAGNNKLVFTRDYVPGQPGQPAIPYQPAIPAVPEKTEYELLGYDDDGGTGYNCTKTLSGLASGTYVVVVTRYQYDNYNNGLTNIGTKYSSVLPLSMSGYVSPCYYLLGINGAFSYHTVNYPSANEVVITSTTNNNSISVYTTDSDANTSSSTYDPCCAIYRKIVTPAVPGQPEVPGQPAIPAVPEVSRICLATGVTSPNTSRVSDAGAGTYITQYLDFSTAPSGSTITYTESNTNTNISITSAVASYTETIYSNVVSNIVCTYKTTENSTVTNIEYKYTGDQNKVVLTNLDNVITTPIKVYEFGYTGGAQEVTLDPGTYNIELWGAGGANSTYITYGSHGGKGGYTSGTITLTARTTLYIYVGQGGSYGAGSNAFGGPAATYNGGGAGGNSGSGSGGGATDIRLLKTVWNSLDGLKSRIMVAGGGGGCDNGPGDVPGSGDDGSGGHGGGLESQGAYVNGAYNNMYKATQTQGYAFGIGASATTNTDTGGAGGGYYGGKVTNHNNGGAGGGSSYVSGYTGCDTTYRDNQKINGAYPSFSNVSILQGIRDGNGYVRITQVQTSNSSKITYNNSAIVPADAGCPSNITYYYFGSDTASVKNNIAQIRCIAHEHSAACPHEYNDLNAHDHSVACIDANSPMYKYMIYLAEVGADSQLDSLFRTYLGMSLASYKSGVTNVAAALRNKQFTAAQISNIPEEVDGYDNLILSCLNHNTYHEHTPSCELVHTNMICNNPHHIGEHQEVGCPICYEPCKDNYKHTADPASLVNATETIEDAVNLDGYFTIYWDNMGDFYDTGRIGSYEPSSEKGQGYVNNMDTTRWIKRKIIIFNDIDVLFFNETTNAWECYKAGEEIYLPVVTDGIVGNGDDDIKRDWRTANQRAVTRYKFYCLMSNHEYDDTSYRAYAEALNAESSEGQGNEPYRKTDNDGNVRLPQYPVDPKETNFFRNEAILNFGALHMTKKMQTFDVMGNIGNLIITYTTDFRWSNFFKQADSSGLWEQPNVLYKVDETQQSRYINVGREVNSKDVRNHPTTSNNRWFDTFNTESWKFNTTLDNGHTFNTIVSGDTLGAQPFVWSKYKDELRCGYDIFCEVTTTGDYHDVRIDYQYYLLDKATGEVTLCDLWSNISGTRQAYYLAEEDAAKIRDFINAGTLQGNYGITSIDSLALYNLYNDLSAQQKLRMVTDDQITTANSYSPDIFGYYINERDEYVPYMPSLERINIGTAYGVAVDPRAMVYVGSSYDNMGLYDGAKLLAGQKQYTSQRETNIGNRIAANKFEKQGRRWLFTAGLAENTVAVKYDGNTHIDLTVNNYSPAIVNEPERYAILVGCKITAYGDVWDLAYDAFEASQTITVTKDVTLPSKRDYTDTFTKVTVGGKQYNRLNAYYDIIAVYTIDNKEDDFDYKQSH